MAIKWEVKEEEGDWGISRVGDRGGVDRVGRVDIFVEEFGAMLSRV